MTADAKSFAPAPDEEHEDREVARLPRDVQAERAVLGSILTSTRALESVLDTGLRHRDFYVPTHELIYAAAAWLHAQRQPVDAMTVWAELVRRGVGNRVGGAAILAELTGAFVTPANADYYARIVAERAGFRRLVEAGTAIGQLGFRGEGDLTDAQEAARLKLDEAASGTLAQITTFADVSEAAIDSIGKEVFTPTPWADLNHVINGIAPARMMVVAARPATGKTVLGVQLGIHVAKGRKNHPPLGVGYYTFEMSGPRLYQRALAYASSVDLGKIIRGELSESEWSALMLADEWVRELPFVVTGAAGWTAADVVAHARATHRKHPLGLVVIDHIGRVKPGERRKGGNREQEVAESANQFLDLAHALDCTVLVVSQLNRGPAQRTDPRPVATDIRESDTLEQNADTVLLLYRDREDHPDEISILVAKNRDGVDGMSIDLTFEGPYSRITDRPWSPSRVIR